MAWWSVFARAATGAVLAPPKRATGGGTPNDEPTKGLQGWQADAWGYSKTLGEIHYAGGFLSRMLAGVQLVVQERVAGEWVESVNPTLIDQRERLENSKGGVSALQGKYGRLIFIQGEAMLACTLEALGTDAFGAPIVGGDGLPYVELWEMLSASELSYSKEQREYTRSRGGTGKSAKHKEINSEQPEAGQMIAYRFYHEDAEFSGLADSSMRAVLDDCEELLLLKQSIRNTARNRGAGNGILFLPSSLGGEEIDMGDGSKIPKNARIIYDALTLPIENEKAAHAVAPVIIFGSDVNPSNAFHVDLRGAALYRETGLRDECIRRIAIGLDMPPESLMGTASSNHWTAWQIDEASWTNHGDPTMREFVEHLTGAILRPVAIEEGLDPRDVRFWYDPSDVVQDPDRAGAAAQAHDRVTISDEAYRRETGFEESDAPTPEEYAQRSKAKAAQPATPPNDGPPIQAAVTPDKVIGMAEACLLRCRELAGSKLRTKMNASSSPPNLRARITSVQNCNVPNVLGVDVRDECDPDALVAGAGQVFLSGLQRLGLEPSLSETLVRRVEEHAARTLFDEESPELSDEVLAICALTSMRL